MSYKPIRLFKINFSSPLIVPSLHGHFPDGWRIMVHDPIDISPKDARCITANKETLIVKIFSDDFKAYGIHNKSLLTLDLAAKPKHGDIVVFGNPDNLEIGTYLTRGKSGEIFNFQTELTHTLENYPLLGVVIKKVGLAK